MAGPRLRPALAAEGTPVLMRPVTPRGIGHRARRCATFVIFDSGANLVASFDDRDEARAVLEQISGQDPNAIEDYAAFEFDSAGHPISGALTAADLGDRA